MTVKGRQKSSDGFEALAGHALFDYAYLTVGMILKILSNVRVATPKA